MLQTVTLAGVSVNVMIRNERTDTPLRTAKLATDGV
jgi:hypothetical protein